MGNHFLKIPTILHCAFKGTQETMFAKKINRVVEKRNEESILKLCFQVMLRWLSLIGLYSEKQHSDGFGHIIRRWIRLDHLRSFYRYFVLFYFETTTSF